MQLQTQANKISEINYRRKISAQHTEKEVFFENEPNQKEIQQFLKKRLEQYKDDFRTLKELNLLKPPFLEIGAEYALASSYLKSKFKSDGIACDISLHSLEKAKHFAKLFKFKKTPRLVCADIESLPFPKNRFPFVFVYESLHHFPDPKTPILSLLRVISPGGTLLIGSEPIKPSLKLSLWNRPNKLRPFEKFLKAIFILPFISNIGKTEIENGIIETSFPIKTWLDATKLFDEFELFVDVFPFGKVQKLTHKNSSLNPITKLLTFTLGGAVKIVGHKKGLQNSKKKPNIYICVECLTKLQKEVELKKVSQKFRCPICKTTYPALGQIPIFLNTRLWKHLL